MRRLLRALLAIAREISDESPYRRYLAARGIAHTTENWRAFFEQRMREKYSRAKCC